MRFFFIALIVALCAVCLNRAGMAGSYTVQALGVSPGYDGGWAVDINEDGVAICTSLNVWDTSGVFIWSSGTGLVDLSRSGISAFAGINNRGQTAGVYTDTSPNWKFEPLIRNADGTEIRLHVPDGVSNAWVRKILDDSSIFLDYEYRDADREVIGTRSAIVDATGFTTYIDAPDGNTSVSAVSNNGTIIVNDKYLWTASGGFVTLPWLSEAGLVDVKCVNDLGWVVGTRDGHIMRWDNNGNACDLGIGVAGGISSTGQVVGSINGLAVMWNVDGSVVNLPSLDGYSNAGAWAINDSGQVVGHAYGGFRHMAVLWQPVPEPSSILALLCGVGGLVGYATRRRTI